MGDLSRFDFIRLLRGHSRRLIIRMPLPFWMCYIVLMMKTADCTEYELSVKLKPVFLLLLRCVPIMYSSYDCLWTINVFKFRNTNFKIFEKFLPVIFHTSTYSLKFSFHFFLPKHIMNPVFSFYCLFVLPKEDKPTCSYHMLLTTIHADFCQE